MQPIKRRTRKEIEEFAHQTLLDHGLTAIPVDPVKLANLLRIRVNHASFADEDISGLIAKRGNEAMVLVNSNDNPFRKRFTIAHELGHFLLHLDHTDGEEVDHASDLFRTYEADEQSADRSKEVEANQFAAALLMPAPQVLEEWKVLHSLEAMAARFNVSEEAMGYRLATLGL